MTLYYVKYDGNWIPISEVIELRVYSEFDWEPIVYAAEKFFLDPNNREKVYSDEHVGAGNIVNRKWYISKNLANKELKQAKINNL